MLLSIGDQVKPGSYRLHSVFTRVVSFERRGRLITLVDEAIGPGPLNIVLRGFVALQVFRSGGSAERRCVRGQESAALCRAAEPPKGWGHVQLEITTRTVRFAGQRYRFASHQRYHSGIELKDGGRFRPNLATLREALLEDAPAQSLAFLLDGKRRKNFRPGFERAYAAQIGHAVRQVFGGRLLQGIRCLKGCGMGLTPGGDDFIAGLLIGLHVLQKLHGRDYRATREAIFRAARADNLFSNTFLDMARRGMVFGRLKNLLVALASGSAALVRVAAQELFTVGHTSGADLATGLFMILSSRLHQDWVGTLRRDVRGRPGTDVSAKRPYQARVSLGLSEPASIAMVGA
jgi:Protein of unknown function (DUF2877)